MRNKNKGFSQHNFLQNIIGRLNASMVGHNRSVLFKKLKSGAGFTLIELLVVVAIIALLTSIALIAFVDARQKGRDTKRLADMTQMVNAMGLFEAANKGYPADADSNGLPDALAPGYASSLPVAPLPPDGACDATNPATSQMANTFWYVPLGTPYVGGTGSNVYPDYRYYFCLGDKTGDFSSGIHYLTPTGIK